jgi:hypothetical protein
VPQAPRRKLAALQLAVLVLALPCAGCAVSVSAGSGHPQEQAYRQALSKPFKDLTAAAAKTSQVCAGGSRPNPQQCYADTAAEIAGARAVEQALRGVRTPPSFAKANADLRHGLRVFVQGLAERNAGLAAHSSAEYNASYKLVNAGLVMQKAALAESPKNAGIVG